MFVFFLRSVISKNPEKEFSLNVTLPKLNATVRFDPKTKSAAINYVFPCKYDKITIPSLFKYKKTIYKTRIISSNAFSGSKFKEVKLPDSLRAIDSQAFANSSITSIHIPNAVTIFNDFVFANCSHLKTANISALHLFDLPNGTFMNCFQLENVYLPPQLEGIGKFAFQSTQISDSFKFPVNLTLIMEKAFYNCTKLNKINLTNTKLVTVESYAFAKCSNLINLTLPPCTEYLFSYIYEDTKIETFTVPEGTLYIGKCALINNKLSVIKSNSPMYVVIDNVLAFLDPTKPEGNELIFFPPNEVRDTFRIHKTTYSLGKYSFAKTNVRKVQIQLSVVIIHKYAFYNSNVEHITFLPSKNNYTLSKIQDSIFFGCKKMNWINMTILPTKIIPSRFFYGCESLKSIILPENTRIVGEEAFAYTSITSMFIPQDVYLIKFGAFSHCKELSKFEVSKFNKVFTDEDGVLYDKKNHSLVMYPPTLTNKSFTVPKSYFKINSCAFSHSKTSVVKILNYVTRIGSRAFECSEITRISLPMSVNYIGPMAFVNCTSLKMANLENATVSVLEESLFEGCSSLKSVVLPNSMKEFKPNIFSGCKSLTTASYYGYNHISGEGLFSDRVTVYVSEEYPPNQFLGQKVQIIEKKEYMY